MLRGKQALLVATLILAGCGHPGAPKLSYQTVRGAGFTFRAPAGWQVEHAVRRSEASSGSELVQVATFALVRPYTASLFTRVTRELDLRMKTLAQQTGGEVAGKTVVKAGGLLSHAYTVHVGDHVDEYTFVLHGKREFQLLCRRRAASSSTFCTELVKSFAAA